MANWRRRRLGGVPVREIGRKICDTPSHWRVGNLSDREIGAEIIESCRVGDRDAFRALYGWDKDRGYFHPPYFFVGDPDLAGDIPHRVFLDVTTDRCHDVGAARICAWLDQ